MHKKIMILLRTAGISRFMLVCYFIAKCPTPMQSATPKINYIEKPLKQLKEDGNNPEIRT